MNRSAVIALAAAAIIGTTGGTYVASQVADTSDPSSSDPGTDTSDQTAGTPSTSASAKPPAEKPAPAFYATESTLVDGDESIDISGAGLANLQSVERIASGWLVVTRLSDQEPSFKAHVVQSDGEVRTLASFFGIWDVNAEGTRFIAMNQKGQRYDIYDLDTGEVTDTVDEGLSKGRAFGNAAFSDNSVVTSWYQGAQPALVREDLNSGDKTEAGTDMTSWTTSPGGLLISGEVTNPDESSDFGGCLSGGTLDEPKKRWTSCDFRSYGSIAPLFSPDGEHLLVVPAATDGFGPGLFGVLDSETGKSVAQFETPEWTTDGRWADDGHVLVQAATDGDMTGWVVHRCDIKGSCVKLSESDEPPVLGSPV